MEFAGKSKFLWLICGTHIEILGVCGIIDISNFFVK